MRKLMILSFIIFGSITALSQFKGSFAELTFNNDIDSGKIERKESRCYPETISSVNFFPFKRGNFEIAFTFNIGTERIEYKDKDDRFPENTHSASFTYAYLYLEPSYYILDNISIQFEIGLNALNDYNLWKCIILNVGYNYKFNNSIFAVFGKMGYGLTNTLDFRDYGYDRYYLINYGEDRIGFKIKVFNSSIGMKVLLNEYFALISEINYKVSSNKTRWDEEHSTSSFTQNKLSLLMGISILF
jgi:hypothetical protein